MLEGLRKCCDRAEAIFGSLGQGAQNHVIQARGDLWIELAGWLRLSLEVLIHHLLLIAQEPPTIRSRSGCPLQRMMNAVRRAPAAVSSISVHTRRLADEISE